MCKRIRVCPTGMAICVVLAAVWAVLVVPSTALAKKPGGGGGGKPQTACYECVSGEKAWTVKLNEGLIGQGGRSRCLSKQGQLRFDARPGTSAKTNFEALSLLVSEGSDSLVCLNGDTRLVVDGFRSNGFTFVQVGEDLVEYRDGVTLIVGGEAIEHNLIMTGTGIVIPSEGTDSTSTLSLIHYELKPRGGGGGRPKNGCSVSGTFSTPIEVVITEEVGCPSFDNVMLQIQRVPASLGDVNFDLSVTVTDSIRILETLFTGGAPLLCPNAADYNEDGKVDLADPVAIMGFLFLGAPSASDVEVFCD